MRYFLTGTDTDAGKTVIAAWLCLHWSLDYWKPVQCGTQSETDSETVARLSGAATFAERYRLHAPRSPHYAAQLENIRIGVRDFTVPDAARLLIEGAGGALVPLNERETMADLMQALGLPVIIAARGGLGTINHTLLTIEALRSRGLEIAGIIFSGELLPENPQAIAELGRIRIIGHLPRLDNTSREALMRTAPPAC